MALNIGGPVSSAFDGYERFVLADAPQEQIDECRLAFMAGAAVVLSLLHKIDDDNEEAACALLDTINSELQDFGQSLDAEWMARTPKGRAS